MHSLIVREMPLSELRPAPYNPRRRLKPTDAAYRKLRASLETFGLVEPLIWNEATGHVVGGHARLGILRELGVETVAVSVVNLDPARERALNVVLNNQDAQGRYDTAKLADLLAGLDGLPELAMTGFDAGTLASLRYEPAEAPAAEATPTAVEVVLVIERGRYAELEAGLNGWLREAGVTAHVREHLGGRER